MRVTTSLRTIPSGVFFRLRQWTNQYAPDAETYLAEVPSVPGVYEVGDTEEVGAEQPYPDQLNTGGMNYPVGENGQIEYSEAYQYRDWLGSPSPYAPPVQFDPNVPEVEEPISWSLGEGFLSIFEMPIEPLAHLFEDILGAEHYASESELDPHPIGIQPIPGRPDLIVETNEYFLGPGPLAQGIELPTGAVWRPALWVFGTYRSGINYFDNGSTTPAANGTPPVSEWANRLDLFAQLNLSGTERILLGLRPFDEEENQRREFSSYDFRNGNTISGTNAEIQTLFFEGDFGEIFPNLDPYDTEGLDYGFSVGRQPMLFQQGLLINEDMIDAVTVTRNTMYGGGNLNMRSTFVYAWDRINRNALNGNFRDDGAQLIGLFTESDFEFSMVNADIAYVTSGSGFGDLIAFGLSGVQRIHGFHNTYNSSVHILGSFPTGEETSASGQGELLFSQLSWTPHHTDDLVYLNAFWAIDHFTSPSRGTLGGGPLGQTGVLFSAAGLGRFGAPLNNQAQNVVGASLGYQMFFDETKQQVIVEIGGRQDTDDVNQAAIAGGMRYQRALNQHWIFLTDAFVAKREQFDLAPGARVEMLMKF